jgi:hypothetical protein
MNPNNEDPLKVVGKYCYIERQNEVGYIDRFVGGFYIILEKGGKGRNPFAKNIILFALPTQMTKANGVQIGEKESMERKVK